MNIEALANMFSSTIKAIEMPRLGMLLACMIAELLDLENNKSDAILKEAARAVLEYWEEQDEGLGVMIRKREINDDP